MWIKICGLTSEEAVAAALALGVDALGFVFTESVRRLTTAQALELARPARARARCVAVLSQPSQALIDEVLGGFRPDVLQGDAGELQGLRLPPALELLPVVRGAVAGGAVPHARILFEGRAAAAASTPDWPARRTRSPGARSWCSPGA